MTKTEYSLHYNESHYCQISAPMTRQFNGIKKDKVITLPPDIGRGYFRYISPCKDMELYLCDVLFYKNTVLSERAYRESYSISFCFSDCLEWGKRDNKLHFRLKKGDCCIYKNGYFEMDNYYEAGQQYVGIGLSLHPERFHSVTELLLEKKAVMLPEQNVFQFQKRRMNHSIDAILQQILSCRYLNSVQELYLEGKMLELASVFIEETVLEKNTVSHKNLYCSNEITLEQIKETLDESFAEPLTISQLAKRSFMSESKLRQEFKRQYGITIYQYILDRRMEKARELIIERNCLIKDAASYVGYSNFSHFSEAFRKRYGYTPSQYLKI